MGFFSKIGAFVKGKAIDPVKRSVVDPIWIPVKTKIEELRHCFPERCDKLAQVFPSHRGTIVAAKTMWKHGKTHDALSLIEKEVFDAEERRLKRYNRTGRIAAVSQTLKKMRGFIHRGAFAETFLSFKKTLSRSDEWIKSESRLATALKWMSKLANEPVSPVYYVVKGMKAAKNIWDYFTNEEFHDKVHQFGGVVVHEAKRIATAVVEKGQRLAAKTTVAAQTGKSLLERASTAVGAGFRKVGSWFGGLWEKAKKTIGH